MLEKVKNAVRIITRLRAEHGAEILPPLLRCVHSRSVVSHSAAAAAAAAWICHAGALAAAAIDAARRGRRARRAGRRRAAGPSRANLWRGGERATSRRAPTAPSSGRSSSAKTRRFRPWQARAPTLMERREEGVRECSSPLPRLSQHMETQRGLPAVEAYGGGGQHVLLAQAVDIQVVALGKHPQKRKRLPCPGL